jgi:hypothetical protein
VLFRSCTSITHAAEPFTQKQVDARNKASGFAGGVKFFVGRAARVCRDVLHKDDAYMKSIVDDWLSRNGKFSGAAEVWLSTIVSYVANRDGLEKGLALRDNFLAITKSNAETKIKSDLGVSEDDLTSSCQSYPNVVHAGKYDITEGSPEYVNLVELVRYINTRP